MGAGNDELICMEGWRWSRRRIRGCELIARTELERREELKPGSVDRLGGAKREKPFLEDSRNAKCTVQEQSENAFDLTPDVIFRLRHTQLAKGYDAASGCEASSRTKRGSRDAQSRRIDVNASEGTPRQPKQPLSPLRGGAVAAFARQSRWLCDCRNTH